MALTKVIGDGLASSGLPTGSVLQVVSTIKTDVFTSSSTTSFVDITGLSASITPISTSSKIMVMVNLKGAVNSHGGFRILRDSTVIGIGDAAGNRSRVGAHHALTVSAGAYTEYTTVALDMHILDSPSTTDAVTYKVQGGTPYSTGYTVYVNRSQNDTNDTYMPRTSSAITLMEVAG